MQYSTVPYTIQYSTEQYPNPNISVGFNVSDCGSEHDPKNFNISLALTLTEPLTTWLIKQLYPFQGWDGLAFVVIFSWVHTVCTFKKLISKSSTVIGKIQ